VRRFKLRQFIVRKSPTGIAISPFEFAFLVGYLIPVGKLLWETYIGRQDPTLKALPFTGWELSGWLWMLFLGALFGTVGILMQGSRRAALFGLQLERFGLILFGGAVTTYVAGIIGLIGWQVANLTLISLVLILLACLFKILQIGQAIETIEASIERPVK
jgi:hypothetical protein